MPLESSSTIIKVSPHSNVKSVAGAISHQLENSEDHTAVMHAIGAGAVNQGAKAVAISRSHMAVKGLDVWTRIGFNTVFSEELDKDVSVMVFNIVAK